MRRAASSSPATRAACSRSCCISRCSAAALARRFAEREREQRRRTAASSASAGRARVEQQAARTETRRSAGERRHEHRSRARARPSRGVRHTRRRRGSAAGRAQRTRASSSPRRPRRAHERRPVVDVLEELRVDLDAGHALAERRRLVVDLHAQAGQRRPAPACRASALEVGAALQHVDRRHEAARVVRRVVEAQRAVGLGRRREASPTDARATPPSRAFRRMSGALRARRARISSASAGTSVPSTLATSGTRRTTPFDGLDRDQAVARRRARRASRGWEARRHSASPPSARRPRRPSTRRRRTIGVREHEHAGRLGRAGHSEHDEARWPIARASSASCDGSASSACASAESCVGSVSSERSGEQRSGSGISMSMPIAAGCRALRSSRISSREHGARPRPLAERGEASLVDRDDRRPASTRSVRGDEPLVGVEPLQLLAASRRRLRPEQRAPATPSTASADRTGPCRRRRRGRRPPRAVPRHRSISSPS